MSRTLSGLFLVGALNRPRKRKGTNQENSRTIPEQIGKIPEKSGKSQTQRALRSKKKSIPIENFNPGSKFSIPIEIFNLDRKFQSPSFYLRGPRSVQRRARSKISIHNRSLEVFNPEGRDRMFSIPGPSGKMKSALPPPPPKPKIPPPLERGILWTGFFLQEERIFSRRP